MANIMKETWNKNPSARLPILRVKKTLQKAIDQVQMLSCECVRLLKWNRFSVVDCGLKNCTYI